MDLELDCFNRIARCQFAMTGNPPISPFCKGGIKEGFKCFSYYERSEVTASAVITSLQTCDTHEVISSCGG